MLSYLPKLYVISLDLQGLLLFDGSLSYTSIVIISRYRNDVICWICKRSAFDGFALTPGLFQLPKHLLSPGFGVLVSFDGSQPTETVSEMSAEASFLLLFLF
jgi:hypothetical protein